MLDTSAPVVAKTLAALREAEAHCTRCSLYKFATQVVPGEGRQAAPMMFVGEQPGEKEDETGRPFVGPAGRILNGALKQAEIDRGDVFVTDAVKHFKHEMRANAACTSGRMHTRSSVAAGGSSRSAPSSNPRLSLRLAQPQRTPFCNAALQSAKCEAVRTF